MPKKQVLNNLQILRAIAAVGVVTFHIAAELQRNQSVAPIIYFIAQKGFSGVDLFFIISGFIMMHSQDNNPRKPLEFFIRRLIRIVPMYYLVTLVYCTIYLIVPELFSTFRFSFPWLLASLTFASWISTFGTPIIIPGWTLEYEILFYGMLAVTYKYFKGLNQIFVAVMILGALVVIGVNSIVLEFLFGMFCAYISSRIKLSQLTAIGLIVLGTMLFLLNYLTKLPEYSRVINYAIPFLFIVLGSISLKPSSNQILISLGNSSYSTYLVQILTIPLFFKVIERFRLESFYGDLQGVAAILFTLILGHFLFWKIERYLDSQIYRRIKMKKE